MTDEAEEWQVPDCSPTERQLDDAPASADQPMQYTQRLCPAQEGSHHALVQTERNF